MFESVFPVTPSLAGAAGHPHALPFARASSRVGRRRLLIDGDHAGGRGRTRLDLGGQLLEQFRAFFGKPQNDEDHRLWALPVDGVGVFLGEGSGGNVQGLGKPGRLFQNRVCFPLAHA